MKAAVFATLMIIAIPLAILLLVCAVIMGYTDAAILLTIAVGILLSVVFSCVHNNLK